jgi:heat shock protein HslJ
VLTYRARVALTPGSLAIVAVQEVGALPEAGSVGETRIDLNGRQVPIGFDFSVPREKFVEGRRYAVLAAIWSDRRPQWVSDTIPLTQVDGIVELGTLVLTPYTGGSAFATRLRCGDQAALIDYTASGIVLQAGGQSFDMKPVEAASGAKYAAVNDSATTLWTRGKSALVTVRGTPYPECHPAGTASADLRARGNEPGWSLEMNQRFIALVTDYGEKRQVMPRPEAMVAGNRSTWTASASGVPVVITVVDSLCRDDMSGMTYPSVVSVREAERMLHGCGGDPASVLQGEEWIVEDIDRRGIIDNSRASLAFGPDGQLSGRASCNSYRATYTLTGEGLGIAGVITTRKACAPSLMDQEARFLAALSAVQRFDIGPTGELILYGPEGPRILARR